MTSAILLHPHPDRGGNQHNVVVTALFERLTVDGITPYRFDFVSADLGAAQVQTVAAIEAAAEPVVLIGYSFGGAVAGTIAHPAVTAWCLIAPALTLFTPAIGPDPRPKLVIAAENDGWFDGAILAAATSDWAATSQQTITGTDHFFGGDAADRVARLVSQWIQDQP